MAGTGDANTKVGVFDGRGSAALAAPTATFQVTYVGFSPAAQAAFQAAVDIWSGLVTSAVPIKISAEYKALPPNVLGSAGATQVFRDFLGAPQAATFYPAALADALSGVDLSPTSSDIVANFSSAFSNWYFGTAFAGTDHPLPVPGHRLGHLPELYISVDERQPPGRLRPGRSRIGHDPGRHERPGRLPQRDPVLSDLGVARPRAAGRSLAGTPSGGSREPA